ncbi:unnamed protein product [Effrenium voratum]|uniref:Uncharacterized protein n=1 Tax=Effrenium voratum TaxID=2562239 RepID=A0AA36HPS1_9DINO|nr:unnamed protein product [Effrenium voratum]CAJ1437116.1 unnamed protein product [Effrenium voratum]
MKFMQTRRQLLQLSRQLRGFEPTPGPELAQVPQLLQRLDVRDHALFEEFCVFSRRSWRSLSPPQLAQLFRDTENYRLLHASKGTALCRLVASLAEGLEDVPPRSLAALCHGALAAKRRPLLPELVGRVEAAAADVAGADAVELLGAASPGHGREHCAARTDLETGGNVPFLTEEAPLAM